MKNLLNAMKVDHVDHLNPGFDMTNLHCNVRG